MSEEHQGGPRSQDAETPLAPVPRLALSRAQAAAALSMSVDSFERYVQPTLPVLRCGSMVLVPTAALEKWLRDRADRVV